MKTYKDATLLMLRDFDEVITSLSESATNGWYHNMESEQSLNQRAIGDMKYVVFSCDQAEDRYAATLCGLIEDTSIKIVNVLPDEGSPNPLDYDQYGTIIDSFISDVASASEKDGFISVLNFSNEIDLEVELGEAIYKKLTSFSDLANKSTGSGHPCDQERWFEFISSAFEADVAPDECTIGCWLVEKGKWPQDRATELQYEYQRLKDFLSFQKKRR